ncbi:MAG: glycosyltransferase family 2 protein, partial [Planctomycetes bacterium]|nr:glycosyltransferase family 2 protein [Planctomycetota bacterium]
MPFPSDPHREQVLSIVIPAYNEAATIAELLRRVLAVELPVGREIIVVDDGSSDSTKAEVAPFVEAKQVRYLRLAKNSGKGKALRAGFAAARGDFVLVQDADLEYDPKDIPFLLMPLLELGAEAVYGSRV